MLRGLAILLLPSCAYWCALMLWTRPAGAGPAAGVAPATRPAGEVERAAAASPDAERAAAPATVSEPPAAVTPAESAIAPAGSVFINQFQLLTQGVLLLQQLDRQLSPLAQEALLLDAQEKIDVEAIVGRVAGRIQSERGAPPTVSPGELPASLRMEPGRKAALIAEVEAELGRVLDEPSLQAVRTLGVEYLLLSPFLLGMDRIDPIPSRPDMVSVTLAIGGASLQVPFLKTRLAPIMNIP